MKTIALTLASFMLTQFSLAADEFSQSDRSTVPVVEPDSVSVMNSQSRESITFIMGEDEPDGNQYYTQAEKYYRYNAADGTEHINTKCRSLQEISAYLSAVQPKNGQPWGKVNIVVHSNEWSDLSVPVIPEGPRASVHSIKATLDTNGLAPVSDDLLDAQSELMVYGCGLGKNRALLKSLQTVFGGADSSAKPTVKSSRYFIFYESEEAGFQAKNCKRFMADYHYTHYPSFRKPSDTRLAKRLTRNYPKADVDWVDALSRTVPDTVNANYHYTFRLPVVWWVLFDKAEDRGDMPQGKEAKLVWLKSQPDLLKAVDDYGFQTKDFRWMVDKRSFEHEDGSKSPAIKIIGQCTIVCVLNPLTGEVDGVEEPLVPGANDESFFGIIHSVQGTK